MKRTGCCGQAWVCACAGGTDKARIAKKETTRGQSFDIFQVLMRGLTGDARAISQCVSTTAQRACRPSMIQHRDSNHGETALIAPSEQRNVHACGLSKPEKRNLTPPTGSTSNAMASSPGS